MSSGFYTGVTIVWPSAAFITDPPALPVDLSAVNPLFPNFDRVTHKNLDDGLQSGKSGVLALNLVTF